MHAINLRLSALHWLAYQKAAVAGGHRSVSAWARYTLHVAAGLVEPEPAAPPAKK